MNLSYVLLLCIVVTIFGKMNVVADGTSNFEVQHKSNETGRKEMNVYQKPGKVQYVGVITNLTAEKAPTSNGTGVRLSWAEPSNLTESIASYTIRYQRVDIEHAKYQDVFVTQNQYRDQGKSYVINNLVNGNYSFTVVASPSDRSNFYWSKPVFFYVDDSTLSATTITLIILAAILVLVALVWFFLGRKH